MPYGWPWPIAAAHRPGRLLAPHRAVSVALGQVGKPIISETRPDRTASRGLAARTGIDVDIVAPREMTSAMSIRPQLGAGEGEEATTTSATAATVNHHEHMAAAVYLMKHAGATAIAVLDDQWPGGLIGIITREAIVYVIAARVPGDGSAPGRVRGRS